MKGHLNLPKSARWSKWRVKAFSCEIVKSTGRRVKILSWLYCSLSFDIYQIKIYIDPALQNSDSSSLWALCPRIKNVPDLEIDQITNF
jgi:hypothetical protein